MTLCFIELKKRSYSHAKFYIVRVVIFDLFRSCDLDLDPMTFIYELGLVFTGDIPDVQI